jgi:hypothetical protein
MIAALAGLPILSSFSHVMDDQHRVQFIHFGPLTEIVASLQL